MSIANSFCRLYEIVVKLRSPSGCPWDREQTPASLRTHLLEETYETIEAIDSGSCADILEELGDVVMLVVLLARMYEEDGIFTVESVLESVSEKLLRRHPHVFSDASVESTAEVLSQWKRIKVEDEGKPAATSLLDQVSRALPALERANKLQRKAAIVGFDWSDFSGVVAKLQEELAEVEEARAVETTPGQLPVSSIHASEQRSSALEQEVGDVLFSAVNVARYLGVDPSIALNRSNQKFTQRFRVIEEEMAARDLELCHRNREIMEEIWNATKTGTDTSHP